MNKKTKLIIIGIYKDDIYNLSQYLCEIDDSLSIAPTFISDDNYIESENQYILDTKTIHLAFKNNALLYIKTDDEMSKGITIDDFYNNDICYMTIDEFNNISNTIFNIDEFNVLVIWIDNNQHKIKDIKYWIDETDVLTTRLYTDHIDYLYFLNEDNEHIREVINQFINGDEQEKKHLLIENS